MRGEGQVSGSIRVGESQEGKAYSGFGRSLGNSDKLRGEGRSGIRANRLQPCSSKGDRLEEPRAHRVARLRIA